MSCYGHLRCGKFRTTCILIGDSLSTTHQKIVCAERIKKNCLYGWGVNRRLRLEKSPVNKETQESHDGTLVEREHPVLLECLRSPQFFVGNLLLNFSVSCLCNAFVDHIFFFLLVLARSRDNDSSRLYIHIRAILPPGCFIDCKLVFVMNIAQLLQTWFYHAKRQMYSNQRTPDI
jgi:hypothetical protein